LQLLRAGLRVIINLAACRGVAAETSGHAVEDLRTAGAEFVTSSVQLASL